MMSTSKPEPDGRCTRCPDIILHRKGRMTKKTVLAIGIEPSFADFGALPGLTPELIRNYIEAQIERLRALGFDAQSCLTDLGDTAEAVVATALRSKRFDCVVIGAGLREPAGQYAHEIQPRADGRHRTASLAHVA